MICKNDFARQLICPVHLLIWCVKDSRNNLHSHKKCVLKYRILSMWSQVSKWLSSTLNTTLCLLLWSSIICPWTIVNIHNSRRVKKLLVINICFTYVQATTTMIRQSGYYCYLSQRAPNLYMFHYSHYSSLSVWLSGLVQMQKELDADQQYYWSKLSKIHIH